MPKSDIFSQLDSQERANFRNEKNRLEGERVVFMRGKYKGLYGVPKTFTPSKHDHSPRCIISFDSGQESDWQETSYLEVVDVEENEVQQEPVNVRKSVNASNWGKPELSKKEKDAIKYKIIVESLGKVIETLADIQQMLEEDNG